MDTNQNVVARYLYDPFGNTLSATGPKAALNKYRFSSKEWHGPSGMVYYLYRWYVPELQRWPNRDPIEEYGGVNLYAFSKNAPIDWTDPLGLQVVGITWQDGTTTTLYNPTIAKFTQSLEDACDTDKCKRIKCLDIKGHADSTMIQLAGDDSISVTGTGKILTSDGNDITTLLQNGLMQDATVNLAGCKTGRGANSIAQDFSKQLPGRIIYGGKGLYQLNVPWTCYAIGKKNAFKNGKLVK